MIFIRIMNNQSQNNQNAPLLNSQITQEQNIIETFLKNDFIRKASSFHR